MVLRFYIETQNYTCVCVEVSLSRETKEDNRSEDKREKEGGGLKGEYRKQHM